MSLSHLALRSVRNLFDTELSPGASINLICGANGSGKTSLLEAIHILGQAKSFRSPRLSQVITRSAKGLTVAGGVARSGDDTYALLRVSYNASGIEMMVNRERIKRVSDLVVRLPLILINTDSHRLLEDGPRLRRRFMDWGVFHVEHQFLGVWKRYYRALRQRNAALRRQLAPNQLSAWDAELSDTASQIDQHRRQYVAQLQPWFVRYVGELIGIETAGIEYRPGWPADRRLAELLDEEAHLDRQTGYTRLGPHRSDLVLTYASAPARHVVSRGQQKLLICALHLAQAALLSDTNHIECVLLVDDLPAELDTMHRNRLLRLLLSLRQQAFVTATEPGLFDRALLVDQTMFHVEQGRISVVAT